MAGAAIVAPKPAAFGAAAEAYGRERETEINREAFVSMHNKSLTQGAVPGESGGVTALTRLPRTCRRAALLSRKSV